MEQHGVFVVTKAFDLFGSTFTPGVLVSCELLPDAMLYRLTLGHNLRIVDAVEMAA